MKQGIRKSSEIPKSLYDMMPKYCANCGATEDLNIHHVIPIALGGKTVISNLVVLCTECHKKIHGRGNIEEINHSELIRKGIAARKAKGLHTGRNPADREPIKKLIAQHCTLFSGGTWTEAEIMKEAGIKRTLFHECLNELKADLKADTWEHTFSKPVQIREHPLHARTIIAEREKGMLT